MRPALFPAPVPDHTCRRVIELVRVPDEREPWVRSLAQQEWALALADRERGGEVIARFEGIGIPRLYTLEERLLDILEEDPRLDEIRVHSFDSVRDRLRSGGFALLGLLEAHDATLWDTRLRMPIDARSSYGGTYRA